MKSDSPVRPGTIEFPLSNKGDRVISWATVCFPLMITVGVFYGFHGSWIAAMVGLLVCTFVYAPLSRGLRSGLDSTVFLDEYGIEMQKKGKIVFSIPWMSIRRLESTKTDPNTEWLQIFGSEGQRLGSMPTSSLGQRVDILATLIAERAGIEPEVYQVPPLLKGTRRGHGIAAIFWSLLAVSLVTTSFLALSFSSAQFGLAAWLFGHCAAIFLASLVAAIPAVAEIYLWCEHRNRKAVHEFAIIRPGSRGTLLAAVYDLPLGIPFSGPLLFAYPPKISKLDLRRELTTDKVRTAGMILFVGAYLSMLWFFQSASSRTLGHALAYLAGYAVLGALILKAAASRSQRLKEVSRGLGDQIVVQHKAIWVERNGRRIPATVETQPFFGGPTGSTGVNRMRMALRVGDETVWYDPLNMFNAARLQELESTELVRPTKTLGH